MSSELISLPIKRLDPEVELPAYAYEGDAGLDRAPTRTSFWLLLSAASSPRALRSRFPRVMRASFSRGVVWPFARVSRWSTLQD